MWLRQLPSFFIRGALAIVPLFLTLYILFWLFRLVDEALPIGIPGLGLLVTVSFITLVGFLSTNVLGRGTFDFAERLLRKVPLVKLLYNSIKDLIGAFVGDKKSFDKPVLVRLSHNSPLRAVGFITREDLRGLDLAGHAAVYFPQSYNFAGNLLMVPVELLEPLDVSSAELMTFVVSGGVSGLGVGHSMVPPAPESAKTTS